MIATAGHCVYSHSRGGWITSAVVIPGNNGTSEPFGSCDATELYSVNGFVQNNDPGYDYGAMKLDCTIGNTVGWFGLYEDDFGPELSLPIEITGYPGDKSPIGTQWTDSGTVDSEQPFPRIFYAVDTTSGQSGSPVHVTSDLGGNCGSFCVIGIHAKGSNSGPYPGQLNGGTRITSDALDNYENWSS